MANAKTLRKRIALVAAAAVGVGMLVATPATAAAGDIATTASITSISVTNPTSPTVGSAAAFTIAVTNGTTITAGTNDSYLIKASITSAPAGGISPFTGAFVAVTGWTDGTGTVGASGAGKLTATWATGTRTAATTSIGTLSFTPAVAGTYSVSFYHDQNANNVLDNGEVYQTATITVGAASAYSNTLSTAIVNGTTTSGATSDASISAIKTVGTQVANVAITLKNTAGGAINGETVSATIAGPGLIAFGTSATTTGTARAASSGALAGNTTWIGVNSDGTAGASTLTISVTDAISGATTTLATKTFTFYGSVASLTVTQNDFVIGLNGAVAGTNAATADNTTWALTPAVVVKALDSNGNVVPNVATSISGLSSDTTVIQSVATLNQDTNGVNGGAGFYNSAITSAAASTSGKSATVTFRYTPDAGVTYISAPALTFTTGGTPATVTFGLDAATYAPGAKGTLTITAKDSAGNPVADGTYAALLGATATSNAAVQGTLPGVAVTLSKGVKTYTLYAPVSPVAFTISSTLGTSVALAAQGTAVSAAASVVAVADPAVAAAKASADAAVVAANAATAAVATLSTTVASLIASITAQLKALSVLVKKIMTKFKIK